MRGFRLQLGIVAALGGSIVAASAADADALDPRPVRGVAAFATAALIETAPPGPRLAVSLGTDSRAARQRPERTRSARPAPPVQPVWLTAIVPSSGSWQWRLAGPVPPPPATPTTEPVATDAADAERSSSARGDKPAPWREVWVGGDWIENAWAAYTGFGAAPFGRLTDNGWRVRSVAGYGRYSYVTQRLAGKTLVSTRHQATKAFADLLVGYQYGLGALTFKGFAGVAGRADGTTPYDPTNPGEGMHYGVKLEADAWLEIAPAWWASASASWTSVHDTLGVRARLGYRITPALSAGIEVAATRSAGDDTGRGGGFLRYAWETGEISVAGGMTGAFDGSVRERVKGVDRDDSLYVSANWLTRF